MNWGIIAPGRIARKFAQDLALSKGSRLLAVASRSLERAQAFASEFGAKHAFGSYEELLSCPDLDVVYVASPHSHHAEHSLLCLRKGIPVLCEKPLAVNRRQVEAMIGAAEANNTFLMEGMWTRFNPAFSHALELVQSGAIGEPQLLRADFGFRAPYLPEGRLYNPALAGGALLDIGIYPVFAALSFLGAAKGIIAQAKLTETGVDATTGIVMTHESGAVSVLDCTIVADTDTVCSIHGEKGNITVQCRFHEADSVVVELKGEQARRIELPKTGIGFYHEIRAVEEALQHGWTEHPKVSHAFSRLLIDTLDRIRELAGIRYPDFD
ncbi:MAG: oxidoreductase [Saprospirales bacterium]|nr:oxidoreductase [Saprospirales bacterium]